MYLHKIISLQLFGSFLTLWCRCDAASVGWMLHSAQCCWRCVQVIFIYLFHCSHSVHVVGIVFFCLFFEKAIIRFFWISITNQFWRHTHKRVLLISVNPSGQYSIENVNTLTLSSSNSDVIWQLVNLLEQMFIFFFQQRRYKCLLTYYEVSTMDNVMSCKDFSILFVFITVFLTFIKFIITSTGLWKL